MQVTRIKTKKQLVTRALEELIKRERLSELKQYQGKIDLIGMKEGAMPPRTRNHSLIEESKQDYQQKLKKELEFLRAQNPFREIDDPVEWQRQQRKDRELPR